MIFMTITQIIAHSVVYILYSLCDTFTLTFTKARIKSQNGHSHFLAITVELTEQLRDGSEFVFSPDIICSGSSSSSHHLSLDHKGRWGTTDDF